MTQRTQITAETEALAKRKKARLSAALKANLVRRKMVKNATATNHNSDQTESAPSDNIASAPMGKEG